jgi:hypothetical protein
LSDTRDGEVLTATRPDRLARSTAVALVGAQHLAQFAGHGNGDVEVRHEQHFRLTAWLPLLRLR